MAIEIVDFPIKNGDFPLLWDSSPEGTCWYIWVNYNERTLEIIVRLREIIPFYGRKIQVSELL